MLYWQYSTPDAFPVLYGQYSTIFPFDIPMQNSLNGYIAMMQMLYCITRFFHGKLFSRFGIYPSRGSYFRRRKMCI